MVAGGNGEAFRQPMRQPDHLSEIFFSVLFTIDHQFFFLIQPAQVITSFINNKTLVFEIGFSF